MKDDDIRSRDREFFDRNPGRKIYVRPPKGWEASQGDLILVCGIAPPGVRLRIPFTTPDIIPWITANADEDALLDAVRRSPMAHIAGAALGC